MSGHGYSHHNPSPTPTASNSSRMDVQGTYVKDIGELPVPESSKQRIEAFFSANSLEFINHRFTQTVSFQGPVGTDLLRKEVTIIVPPEVASDFHLCAPSPPATGAPTDPAWFRKEWKSTESPHSEGQVPLLFQCPANCHGSLLVLKATCFHTGKNVSEVIDKPTSLQSQREKAYLTPATVYERDGCCDGKAGCSA